MRNQQLLTVLFCLAVVIGCLGVAGWAIAVSGMNAIAIAASRNFTGDPRREGPSPRYAVLIVYLSSFGVSPRVYLWRREAIPSIRRRHQPLMCETCPAPARHVSHRPQSLGSLHTIVIGYGGSHQGTDLPELSLAGVKRSLERPFTVASSK